LIFHLKFVKIYFRDFEIIKGKVFRMKKKIHPPYYDTTVTCACGETFVTGSTVKEMKVEICSKCHPYFTGKQKFVDTAGRVERFQKRLSKARKSKKTKE